MEIRGPVEFEIDGVKYKHTPLIVEKAFPIVTYFASVLLPAIGAATSDQGAFFSALGPALSKDDGKLLSICKTFSESTVVVDGDNEKKLNLVFNQHFSGKFFSLFQFAQKCIEVNFSDFIEGLGSKLKR